MPDNTPATQNRGGATTPARQSGNVESGNNPLVTPKGTTEIADGVVTKIAGLAAREISGVHALGNSAGRALSSLRQRIPGQSTDHSQGVSVETADQTARIAVSIVADYGVAIADLAGGIRQNVISAVERMTGMHVETVDIDVTDVYIPSDDDDSSDSDQ